MASTADLLCLTIDEQSVESTRAGGDVPTRGIVGGMFDEIEVAPLFAPEPSYASATFMMDRGSKHLGPIPTAQEVRLFVGAKGPGPTVDRYPHL